MQKHTGNQTSFWTEVQTRLRSLFNEVHSNILLVSLLSTLFWNSLDFSLRTVILMDHFSQWSRK